MSTTRVDVWIWSLIYFGLIMITLGLSVRRTSPTMGWIMAGFGIVLSVTGAALILIRSKMVEPVIDEAVASTANRDENLKRGNP